MTGRIFFAQRYSGNIASNSQQQETRATPEVDHWGLKRQLSGWKLRIGAELEVGLSENVGYIPNEIAI